MNELLNELLFISQSLRGTLIMLKCSRHCSVDAKFTTLECNAPTAHRPAHNISSKTVIFLLNQSLSLNPAEST